MHPDLVRLIRLQDIDNAADAARRTIAALPGRLQALDSRLADAEAAVAAARQRLADNQTRRRVLERDLASVQGRLSRYRDQLMEVKTNKEYTAMQKEIAVAEHEVRHFEDQILVLMLDADELNAAVKQTESALAAERQAVAAERRALEDERAGLAGQLDRTALDRARLVADLTPQLADLFEQVARTRKGVAVAEARNGHCTICHVRLRPQVFNDIRRNDSLIQCESCQRILFFAAAPVADAPST